MKHNLSEIAKNVRKVMKKHSPEILTGIGIAGMITTTVIAVRATPKALTLINEKKEQQNTDKLTTVETVKTVWHCYIPSAISITVSILCLIGASSVNLRRNAALATAYTLSESALKEYTDKVIDTIGEKKEQAVRDSVAKDKIDKNPVSKNEVIITNKGDMLCYDAISGRYYKSDIDKIKKAENELNKRMINEMSVSLNDFYYEIGLDGIGIGDSIGWNINKGLIALQFSSQLTEDGTPCLVIDYSVVPDYEYY